MSINKVNKRTRGIIFVVMAVVVVAMFTGFAVWYVMDQNAKKAEVDYKKRIESVKIEGSLNMISQFQSDYCYDIKTKKYTDSGLVSFSKDQYGITSARVDGDGPSHSLFLEYKDENGNTTETSFSLDCSW